MPKVFWFVILMLSLFGSSKASGQSQPTSAPDTQISDWVGKLESDNYAARSVATERLIRAGPAAIAPVVSAVETGGLERIIRGIYILRQLALNSNDSDVQSTAYSALTQISNRRMTTASRRAASAMSAIDETRQRQAQLKLEQLGATVSIQQIPFAPQRIIAFPTVKFSKGWRGSVEDLKQLRWLTRNSETQAGANWLLSFHGEQVTDAWLTQIATLDNVAMVQFNSTSVTDDGVAKLCDMPDLEFVDLLYTPVTTNSLTHLRSVQNLQRLKIYGTKISEEESEQFKNEVVTVEVDHRHGGFLGIGCEDNPCRVTQVRVNTAAAKAGLQIGDVITAFNDAPVGTMEELTREIAKNSAGDSVKVSYRRGVQTFSSDVILGRWE